MKKLLKGAQYAFSGFNLITHARIRRFVLIPFVINCLLFSVALWYGTGWIDSLINSWLPGWLEWLRYLIWPLLALLALAIIFSTFTLLANLLGAPFNSMLAEAVETRLSGQPLANNPKLGNITRIILTTVGSEVRKLLFFGLRALPLLILFFIPGVNFFAPFIWFLFGAWMLAHEYMDYPLGNQDYAFSQQRQLLRQNRFLILGFGAAVMLMTLIPVVNFFAMPVAVSGATQMWFEQFRNT